MQEIETLLVERGLDLVDPAVRFAMKEKMLCSGLPEPRRHIPKKYLGKTDDGQTRTQRQARETVSQVLQVRAEVREYIKKKEEVKNSLIKLRRNQQLQFA